MGCLDIVGANVLCCSGLLISYITILLDSAEMMGAEQKSSLTILLSTSIASLLEKYFPKGY